MFSLSVKVPPDTVYKWLKVLRIVEFAFEELDQLRRISLKPEVQNTLPKVGIVLETNKNRLFVEVFWFPANPGRES